MVTPYLCKLCYYYLYFVLFLLSLCRPSVDPVLIGHMEEQMSRQQGSASREEGTASTSASGELSILHMFKLMIEEQRQSDRERRTVEAEAEGLKMVERRQMEKERLLIDERREKARVERDMELAEQQKQFQRETQEKAKQSQLEMLKLQEQIQDRAREAFRKGQTVDRSRDRARQGIPCLKEGGDLEDFFSQAEKGLVAAGIDEGEWIELFQGKLSGTVGRAWVDIVSTTNKYWVARSRVLESSGYTPSIAATAFYGFKQEDCRGKSADKLWYRGQQLFRRMTAPLKSSPEFEFLVLSGWVKSVIPRRARLAMESRTVTNSAELISVLQDFLVAEGERTEGKAAVFSSAIRETSIVGSTGGSAQMRCYRCDKVGHRAADCHGSKAVTSSGQVEPEASVKKVVRCFTCQTEGHKSPNCPQRFKTEKGGKEAPAKQIKRVWRSGAKCKPIDGVVNGIDAKVLLDSGADITVVPRSMVSSDHIVGGGKVAGKPFQADKPMMLPVAVCTFNIGGLEWSEQVAVAPEGDDEEVLYSLELDSDRGIQLVLMYNGLGLKDVRRVVTRAQAKEEQEELEEEEAAAIVEQPLLKPVELLQKMCAEHRPDTNGDMKDRACVDGSADVVVDVDVDAGQECSVDSEFDLSEEEDTYVVREDLREEPELAIQTVKEGSSNRKKMVEQTASDPSLAKWRACASGGEDGFVWRDGLLFKSVLTHLSEVEFRLAIPITQRMSIMRMAHETLGHMGARRVVALIKRNFVWPSMGVDITQFCRSCDICQRSSKHKPLKVPMMERRVMAEPFEVMGIDLVGPFKTGKGGFRHLLTVICMASKWPEAIPLKSSTATVVARALVEVFSRTGVPLEIVTDQGPQFMGKVMTQLCASLKIQKIQTTPYHPEGNGVVERMHGTLCAMLTKATQEGLDWVGQVPFALFALRAAPNRDTRFSPYKLVYGRHIRTPLDIMYQGWAQDDFEQFDTSE